MLLMLGHRSAGCTATPRTDRSERQGDLAARLGKAVPIKGQQNIPVLSQATENM